MPAAIQHWGPALVALAMGSSLVGCRDEQAGPRPRASTRPARAAGRVLQGGPEEMTYRSGGSWGSGAILYLGSRVSPAKPGPGELVTLAHYFQAVKPPPRGFRFFVHFVDAATGEMVFNADHEIQGGALPLANWPLGKVIEKLHSVRMPPAGSYSFRVLLGFWLGDRRLEVDAPSAQASENRMLGPILESPTPAVPQYRPKRSAKPPLSDGLLADRAWNTPTPVDVVRSPHAAKPLL